MARRGKASDEQDSLLADSVLPSRRDQRDKRLKIAKTIRVAVSGDVFLTGTETKIVDAASFQRLRRIRQLGTSYLVYPTAVHTRFDHSLGTLAMTSTMVHLIASNSHSDPGEREISPEQMILARLYSLLHDITHVPFGHTIEDELGILTRHDKNAERIDQFLGPTSEIGELIVNELGSEVHSRLMAIYRWDGVDRSIQDDAFVYDLVSNTVCADLLDYLARDYYFCGLGSVPEPRFLNYLYLRPEDGLRRVFVRLWKPGKPVPRRDTLSDLAGLLHARYLLAERVYFHHAKVIAGAMLGRALLEACQSKALDERQLWGHGDESLMAWMASQEGTLTGELARKVLDRRLHKLMVKFTDVDFAQTQEHNHEVSVLGAVRNRLGTADLRRALENELSEQVGGKPGDLLIYVPSRGMNLKAAEMRVLWKGDARKLHEIDDPVVSPRLKTTIDAHQSLWGVSVMCSPDWSETQRARAVEGCRIELCTSVQHTKVARLGYYEKLVEEYVGGNGRMATMSPTEFITARQRAAELLEAKAYSGSWSERIKGAVEQAFSRAESAT